MRLGETALIKSDDAVGDRQLLIGFNVMVGLVIEASSLDLRESLLSAIRCDKLNSWILIVSTYVQIVMVSTTSVYFNCPFIIIISNQFKIELCASL